MPRKALLCVLQLNVRSITCPGVLLKDKEELYLSVSVLGQYKKTQHVPAAFPLFFQEKLVFEKAFADVVDPGDLVKLLEFDTAVLELIQLVPPVGKILATYEENTRDFLFPDPKLSNGHRGLNREILMKRSSSFTGIAPKLRFSTSSLITESLLSSGRSHIQIEQLSPGIKLHTWCPTREGTAEAWTNVDHDPSLLGSYRLRKAKTKSTHGKDFESSGVCNEDMLANPPDRQSRSAGSLEHSAPPAFQKHSPSSVLNRSSLRERFSSGWPSPANGDEIHKRVRNILRTHSARQRLVFDETNSSKGDLTKTREPLHKAPLSVSELQSSSPVQQKAAAHLDNGDYWSSRAAVYKGKPHRAIFEESLEKIYRSMYQKASGTV
ncbi:spermatogenesis-associated protein 6 isoform X4 [Pogoniulus pusillus]|uniref:spermatogenesis-associated protein 6 isoform X4 n=1 Tax=Pogoniulus pusillus TaxID=488313 RepID=UPI0030B93938